MLQTFEDVRAGDVSWAAAEMCLQTHGGFGFACEYDVERMFRETRLYHACWTAAVPTSSTGRRGP